MRVPKFLALICGVLVCISLIRAVNGVGEISLDRILLDLQLFDPNFDDFVEFVQNLKDGLYDPYYYEWNDDLTGWDGFWQNMKGFVTEYFISYFSFIVDFVQMIWELLTEGLAFLGALIIMAFETVGFST